MSTNREIYFRYINQNEFLNKNVVVSLLAEANGFKSTNELLFAFDNECVNPNKAINFLEKAKNGIPYQYVINKAWFLEYEFFVNNSVLIPRQETEQLVLEALKNIPNNSMVCDLCTGSGVIGISLKKKNPTLTLLATDIDKNALDVAAKNALLNNAPINFYQGDLLDPIIQNKIKLDVLVCNPPYIESKKTISNQTWTHEPHIALLSSPATLFYERIFKDYKKVMKDSFMMFFEIGEEMVSNLENLINKYFSDVKYYFSKDLYNKFRFLHIMK